MSIVPQFVKNSAFICDFMMTAVIIKSQINALFLTWLHFYSKAPINIFLTMDQKAECNLKWSLLRI